MNMVVILDTILFYCYNVWSNIIQNVSFSTSFEHFNYKNIVITQHWHADSIRGYVLIYYDYGGHLDHHLGSLL